MRSIFLCVIVMLLIITGCHNQSQECTFSFKGVDGSLTQISGCMIDSLEEGEWTVYDESGQKLQKGVYKLGIKMGVWNYYRSGREIVRKINWNKFEYPSLGLTTNLPVEFTRVTIRDSILRIDKVDTSSKLTIGIGIYNIKDENIDSFYLKGESDILANGWQYNVRRKKMVIDDKTFYLSIYSVSKGDSELTVSNLYGEMKPNKLISITVTCDEVNVKLAKILLPSIATNFFLDNKRLIHPLDEINIEE
jgi:hypothetical protein